MIGGIAKISIQLYSNINSKGYTFNGKRLGFSLKEGISWFDIPFQRDSASESGSVSNLANNLEAEFKTIGINTNLLYFNGKRIVCKYVTSNNEERIIGAEQPITISISYSTGEKLGDEQGMMIKLSAKTRHIPELNVTPTIPPEPPAVIPDSVCFLRADSVELYNGYVKRLIDKSGNGYHGVSSDQYSGNPYIQNALNGKPVVHVNTASIYIDSIYIGNTALWGGGINGLGVLDEYTLLMVVKPLEQKEIFYIQSANLLVYINWELKLSIIPRGTGLNFDFADFFNYKLIAIRYPKSNNEADFYINTSHIGTFTAGTNAQNFNPNKIFIGATNGINQLHLAELRIWDKVLTDVQLEAIIQQIMTYYAL